MIFKPILKSYKFFVVKIIFGDDVIEETRDVKLTFNADSVPETAIQNNRQYIFSTQEDDPSALKRPKVFKNYFVRYKTDY